MSALGKNMCLDFNMQEKKLGLWQYKGDQNQKYLLRMENNRIMISPCSANNAVMEIEGGVMGNGIRIVPANPSGRDIQKFHFVPAQMDKGKGH